MVIPSAVARGKRTRAERPGFDPLKAIASWLRARVGRVRAGAARDGHRDIVDGLPDAVLRFDPALRCVYVNRSAAALGMSPERALGRTLAEIGALPETVAGAWEQKCRGVIAERRAARFHFSSGTASGLRHYTARIVPELADDGRVRGALAVVSDATHRVETERELDRSRSERDALIARETALRLETESMTRDALAAGRAKDQFLATVSHELRAPLNCILGWTQTLRDGEPAAQTLRRGLDQIEQGARAQARLIDDLLSISDIAAGRLRLDVAPMRLGSAIAAAVASLRPAIDARRITLETRLDPAADLVHGDARRLQQVIWTLLSNAVKFTPAGGRVRVDVAPRGSQAELRVSDDGEGIEPEFLPFVFEQFRQADASSRRPHGGLGLGLSIARHLVELHGGTLEASSRGKGKGAAFTLGLPLAGDLPEGSRAGQRERERRDLAGLRILAVDDDASTREMLQQVFENAGAQVVLAGSAREALSQIQRFSPHALVSDIGMPHEDGYDLLRQVRALPPESGGATPAVALTGYTRDKDRAATRDAGYQAFACKPLDVDELFSAIRRVAAR
jgi:PAS domain S-box-containing protein